MHGQQIIKFLEYCVGWRIR